MRRPHSHLEKLAHTDLVSYPSGAWGNAEILLSADLPILTNGNTNAIVDSVPGSRAQHLRPRFPIPLRGTHRYYPPAIYTC